jgi:hypothetical protein
VDELEDELPRNSSGGDAPEVQKRPILSVFCAGGAEGVEPLTSSLRKRSWRGDSSPGAGASASNVPTEKMPKKRGPLPLVPVMARAGRLIARRG